MCHVIHYVTNSQLRLEATHTCFPTLRQGESILNFHVQTLIGRIQKGCSLRGLLRLKRNGTRAETDEFI